MRCGLKTRHEGEYLVKELSIHSEQPLWILLLVYSFFDSCIKFLCMLSRQFNAEICSFWDKKCSVRLLAMVFTSKHLADNNVENFIMTSKRHLDVIYEKRAMFLCTCQLRVNSCQVHSSRLIK